MLLCSSIFDELLKSMIKVELRLDLSTLTAGVIGIGHRVDGHGS